MSTNVCCVKYEIHGKASSSTGRLAHLEGGCAPKERSARVYFEKYLTILPIQAEVKPHEYRYDMRKPEYAYKLDGTYRYQVQRKRLQVAAIASLNDEPLSFI